MWPLCNYITQVQQAQHEPNIDVSEQYVRHFSNWSSFFFLKLMVIWAWRCDFVKLLHSFIRQLTFSFHTVLHDLPHHRTMKRECSRLVSLKLQFLVILFSSSRNPSFKLFCFFWQYPCLSDILFECNPNKHGQGMMLVLPNQRLSKVFSMWDWYFVSFQLVLNCPHTRTRTVLVSVYE